MEEILKDIKGFEGRYQVSNTGRVFRLAHKTTWVNKNNKEVVRSFCFMERKVQKSLNKLYLAVNLKHSDNFLIHRLVAVAFIPNPLSLEFVNHKDGNKHNNNVENLEWCTRQQNEDHAFATGLKNSTGEHNTMAKLTDKQAKIIKNQTDRSVANKKALVKEFNVHRATIERIWNNKIWTHIS